MELHYTSKLRFNPLYSESTKLTLTCSTLFFSLLQNFYQTEQLLLKVTYHPYWKCAIHPSAETTEQARDWHEISVHHVTPNLMSLVLPPGRHHVTCRYKNPVYQKVGFALFIVVFIALMVKESTTLLLRS